MNRSNFLKILMGFVLFPSLVFGKKPSNPPKKKDCITSCGQCRKDYECCKIPKWVSEEEFKIMQDLLPVGWVLDSKYEKGSGYTITTVPCPFLTKENKCSIYEVRPHMCRTYFCDDFCLSKEEKEKITKKVLKEWNFGKDVK